MDRLCVCVCGRGGGCYSVADILAEVFRGQKNDDLFALLCLKESSIYTDSRTSF